MEKLLKLLSENTDEKGYFTMNYNPHKCYYTSIDDFLYNIAAQDDYDQEYYKSLNLTGDTLWQVFWFKNTPVSHEEFVDNTIEGLTKQIERWLNE